jgi:hypothetical protein
MKKTIQSIFTKKDFNFILSMDCEGTNFDKNLKENVLNLERMLSLNSDNNIYTLLFITPYFADMLSNLNLVDIVTKKYKTILGLHIHPNNLPEEIHCKLNFISEKEDLIASYTFEEQLQLIKSSADYLKKRGILNLEGFRGGYFSIDNNTAKAVTTATEIYFESHNIFRNQYKVNNQLLDPYPVYAYDDSEEFRLEYFDTSKLLAMLGTAVEKNDNIIALTHSYLLSADEIHDKMKAIIKFINRK